MKVRSLFLSIALLFTAACHLPAQTSQAGSITGLVKNAEGENLEYVTLILLQRQDSSYVSGTISNAEGRFELQAEAGDYLLESSMMGYRKEYREIQMAVNSHNDLGTLHLQEDSHLLSEVTVTAHKQHIELAAGKTTINLSSSIIGSEGNLIETLKNLPGVVLREDGTLLLNGQAGATVLIDGKETYLSGENLLTYLRAIPASAVNNIELITHPSSRYDAAGNAGKINIRMKKARMEGVTIPVHLGYRQGKYSKEYTGLNVNLKKNKVTFYSTYSYQQGIDKSDTDIDRSAVDYRTGIVSDISMIQETHRKFDYKSHFFRGGIDYELTDKVVIGTYSSGTFLNRTKREDMTTGFYKQMQPTDSTLYTTNHDRTFQRNLTGGASFSYKPYQGADWQTAFDYQLFHFGEDQMQQSWKAPSSQHSLRGKLDGDIHLYAGQTMLSLPFKEKYKLEAGAKTTFTRIDNQAVYYQKEEETWTQNKTISNQFSYNENIHAGYIQLQAEVNEKFSFEAGLRIENTRFTARLKEFAQDKDSVFKDTYTHLFPTGLVQYKINDRNVLALLYARRIMRPNYRDLNPFIEIRDNYLYETGNTELKPQFTDNIELSYMLNNKFAFNLFLAYTHDPITKTFLLDEEERAWAQPTNLKSNYATGIKFNGSNLKILPWWTLNTAMTFIYKKYQWEVYATKETNQILTPFIHLNNQLQLPKGWNAEITLFYQGKTAEGQATIHPIWMASAGIGKKIWKNKMSVKLYVNDIFASVHPQMDVKTINMMGTVKERQDNTYVGLNISYLFNKGKETKKSGLKSGIDESKRINL